MKSTVSHLLHLAEALLKEKKLEAAKSTLGEIDSLSISPEEKAEYCLLWAEANIRQSQFDVAEHLLYAIEFYKSGPKTSRYADAKYWHGNLLTLLGDFGGARETLLEAYVSYRQCHDLSGQGLALNRLSFIANHAGDGQLAVSYLSQCLEIYTRLDNPKNRASIATNLAMLRCLYGEIVNSISEFASLRSIIPTLSDDHVRIHYLQSAIPHILQGDAAKAWQALKQAEPLLAAMSWDRATYYELLGWMHLIQEQYAEAELALQEGLAIALQIAPGSALVSQTKRLLADTCLGLGRYDYARALAEEALEVAQKLNERAEIAACYRVFARWEQANGNANASRTWFMTAMDLFGSIGRSYELALTRYWAGISDLYQPGEHQALLYLAREFFKREGVTIFCDRIDLEMTRGSSAFRSPNRSRLDTPVIVTTDPAVDKLIELARHVASSDMPVLLTGPTGTGNDLLAEYIHRMSGRTGNFVAVNSAAVPDNMIEAELFGSRKGAFTGAERDKIGLIEEADGGTLYLNEIADSSSEFQAKLLDALERKRIRRLGETEERPVDFRVVAATNHDVDKLITEGKFRIDLFHRLNAVPINLPPLGERLNDIGPLAAHFLALAGLPVSRDNEAFQSLIRILSAREWPGNIRQLRAEIQRLIVLSKGSLPAMLKILAQQTPSERDHLLGLLDQTDWNRREVARLLKVSDMTVRRWIKKFGLEPSGRG